MLPLRVEPVELVELVELVEPVALCRPEVRRETRRESLPSDERDEVRRLLVLRVLFLLFSAIVIQTDAHRVPLGRCGPSGSIPGALAAVKTALKDDSGFRLPRPRENRPAMGPGRQQRALDWRLWRDIVRPE
jgi:hypothetical protein